MARPKVDRTPVTMKLRTDVVALADAGAARDGMSRTAFVEQAIRRMAHGAPWDQPEVDPRAPLPRPERVPEPTVPKAARTGQVVTRFKGGKR